MIKKIETIEQQSKKTISFFKLFLLATGGLALFFTAMTLWTAAQPLAQPQIQIELKQATK